MLNNVFANLNNVFANVDGEYQLSIIIQTLMNHKDSHITTYLIAVKEYQRQFGELLHKAVSDFENNGKVQIVGGLGLTAPVNKSDEYQNLIDIFMNMEGTTIRLNMQQANCIINDEWDWVRTAKMINECYYNETTAIR